MSVSAQEMLDAVEAAIQARLTGGAVQSYSIEGRNLQYVSLADLYKMRKELQTEVARQSGGDGTTNLASFRRPS